MIVSHPIDPRANRDHKRDNLSKLGLRHAALAAINICRG